MKAKNVYKPSKTYDNLDLDLNIQNIVNINIISSVVCTPQSYVSTNHRSRQSSQSSCAERAAPLWLVRFGGRFRLPRGPVNRGASWGGGTVRVASVKTPPALFGGGQQSIAGMPYILISTQIRLVCMLHVLLFHGDALQFGTRGLRLIIGGVCRMFLRNVPRVCVCTLGENDKQPSLEAKQAECMLVYFFLFLSH